MSLQLPDPGIILETIRCQDCGRWWALEKYASGKCPICADRKVDAAYAAQQHAERQVRALRGALTRAAARGREKR